MEGKGIWDVTHAYLPKTLRNPERVLKSLQDTRRMHKEEVDLIEVELLGRERVAKASADKAAAEASGELALARAAEKLLQTEARIDRIKQQLFFPSVKGYK